GDWVSFWLGVTFHTSIARMWPLTRFPDLIPRGHAFVERWGIYAVFIGRFFGPLRASVPLAAGILEMPWWPFQVANFTSAFLWAALVLAPGAVGMKFLLYGARRSGNCPRPAGVNRNVNRACVPVPGHGH